MIGRLRGLLLEKTPPLVLLEVGGVGYEVEAPMSTFYQLPAIGNEIVLHTHMVVREDAQLLFGFADVAERSLFRALLKVNGIGAKIALAILSGMDSSTFVCCVQEGDIASLTRVPGIGKKTAERLVIELRDRLADWQTGTATLTVAVAPIVAKRDEVKDAISALVSLGYKPPEASRMVSAVPTEDCSSEEIIREALKNAMKK
ncbi:MAG: Holliday junction branch migration protein RuvA [Thiohalomonadaceae bacterium]|jgi:Holliday junction DNA helicase RuvA